MDLLRQLIAALRALPDLNEIDMDDLRTVSHPSWAVTYTGRQRVGGGYKDTAAVHLWAGPAYRPDIEVLLAAATLTVSEAMLAENLLIGDWTRLPEEALAKMPFAHLMCEVRAP